MRFEGLWLCIEIQSDNQCWQPKKGLENPTLKLKKERAGRIPALYEPASDAKNMATAMATRFC
jgi:hypothetical protein